MHLPSVLLLQLRLKVVTTLLHRWSDQGFLRLKDTVHLEFSMLLSLASWAILTRVEAAGTIFVACLDGNTANF